MIKSALFACISSLPRADAANPAQTWSSSSLKRVLHTLHPACAKVPDQFADLFLTSMSSCQRPTTLALSRTFVQAVLNVVTRLVGAFGRPLPARVLPLRLAFQTAGSTMTGR